MTENRFDDIRNLLEEVEKTQNQSSAQLLPLLYDELRRLARRLLSTYPKGQTLQATALVHEAYLRLGPQDSQNWNNRRHFFGAASLAMRRILVEQARRKKAVKHGGNLKRLDIELDNLPIENGEVDILALDQALNKLDKFASRKVEVVQLRYFTGLSIAEVAETLQVSEATVERDWRFARAYLFDRLNDSESRSLGGPS